jgi:hypothetical protein
MSTALVLLTGTRSVQAGGVNFSWDDCLPERYRTGVRFDCTASTLVQEAVGSFMLYASMPDFIGLEIVIDLQAQATTLPDWWLFAPSPGACRGSALTMSFDFSTLANSACADPFGGQALGFLANYVPSGNRARIIGIGNINPEFPQGLEHSIEYYGFRLRLKLDRATGPDACAGCTIPVQLVLNSINAVGVTDNEFSGSAISNQVIQWQCGGCPTPTLSRTWGQIKGHYRP